MAFASDEDSQNFFKFLDIYYLNSKICEGDEVVDWLAKRGSDPDFWHETVTTWNWDAGVDVLHWIARQPTCETATACWILIVGGSGGHLHASPSDYASVDLPTFELYRDIADRLRAGFYCSNRLGFRGENARKFDEGVKFFKQTCDRIGNPAIWQLPESAFGPFEGREAIAPKDALFDDGQLRMTMDHFRETYSMLDLPTWRTV